MAQGRVPRLIAVVKLAVKVNVPAVVGVPVIRPGLPVSSSPGGSSPEMSVHVYSGTPPSAKRFPQQ
jgi:hypothetical protein